jgi:hypothetical protein
MNNKAFTRLILVTGLFAVVSFSSVSFAQPPWFGAPADEMPKAFMAHEDGNGDGKVTPEEYKGPENHWAFFDKNKDGFLTIDEAARPDNIPPELSAANPASDKAPDQAPVEAKPLYGKAFIDKFDFDKDGKVNHEEWEGVKNFTFYKDNHFPDFDKNRDGFIILDEAPQK